MLPDALLGDVFGAFGVRPEGRADDNLRHLLAAARRVSPEAAATALSVLVAQGVVLSARAAFEFDDAIRRAALYEALFGEVGDLGKRAKGGSIDARYSDGVRRFGNDLDIVLSTPDALWQAAARLDQAFAPTEVTLTLLDDEILLSMRRDAAYPAEERQLKIELSTVALPGNGETAPILAPFPAPDGAAQLLFVAEEHYQRDWRPLDALDAAFLTRAGAWESVLPQGQSRADALLSLADHMERLTSAKVPNPVRAGISEAAGRGATGPIRLPMRVAHGLRASRLSSGWERCELEGKPIVRSPIGTFLLSDDAVYRQEDINFIRQSEESA